jgi:hypothetical protein
MSARERRRAGSVGGTEPKRFLVRISAKGMQ